MILGFYTFYMTISTYGYVRSIKLLDSALGIVSNAKDMKNRLSILIRANADFGTNATNQTQLMPANYWKDMFKPHVSLHGAACISQHTRNLIRLTVLDSVGCEATTEV